MMEENRNSRKAILTSILNWVTALSSLAIALVGIFALVIAQKQIVEMHDEAKIQHLTAFVDKFDSPEQATIRRNLALKRVDQTSKSKRLRQYEPGTPPVEFDEELGFCNDLGLLTEHGYLDRHDVWSAFGQWLFYLYGDARPYLDNLISQADYSECKNLVESIRPIEIKEGGSTYDHPSEAELYDSYMDDIEKLAGQPAFRGRGPKKK